MNLPPRRAILSSPHFSVCFCCLDVQSIFCNQINLSLSFNHEKKVLSGDSTLQPLQEMVEFISEERQCYFYEDFRVPKSTANFGLVKYDIQCCCLRGIYQNLLNEDLSWLLRDIQSARLIVSLPHGFTEVGLCGGLFSLDGGLAKILRLIPAVAFLWSCLRLRIVLFMAATHAFQSYPVSFRSKDGQFS